MTNSEPWAGILAIGIVFFCIGFLFGLGIVVNRTNKDMIQRGLAWYTVDPISGKKSLVITNLNKFPIDNH